MTKRQPKQRSKSSHNTGKLSFDDMENMLYTLFDDTANGIEGCGARELTETTLGMARIVKILLQQRKSKEEDSSGVILRRLLLSIEMTPNSELFKHFANASVRKLDQFNARDLSNLAYAYALIDFVPEFDDGSDLFDHIAINAVDIHRKFNAQDISNMTWAYATVGKPDAALFEAMGDQIVASNLLKEFRPQALSNTVWAYATADVPHAKIFEKVANHIVESDSLGRFDPQALSNIVWAYAAAQFPHPKMFRKVAEAAIRSKGEFISQDVANLLWSYATMGITDKQLFLSIVPTAAKLIDSYTNQGLANIAWAYAVADVNAPPLFNAHFINKCVEKEDGFEIENYTQLYQWYLWQANEISHPGPGLPTDFQNRCHEIFISREPRVSKLQDDVVAQLSYIGLDPKEEVLLDSGYRIDALVEMNGKQVGIEVDGPYHFIGKSRSRSPLGSTILKRRQVPLIDGIELVSVPYWKWDKLGKDEVKKQEYLRNLLSVKSDNA